MYFQANKKKTQDEKKPAINKESSSTAPEAISDKEILTCTRQRSGYIEVKRKRNSLEEACLKASFTLHLPQTSYG